MKQFWSYLAAALLAVPALAQAQGEYSDTDEEEVRKFDVQLQGGIGGWTGDAASVTTNVGPSYGVVAAYNQMPWLSYELGYSGNTNSFSNLDGRLTANRIQGDIKVGPRLAAAVRPYAFAGLGLNFVASGSPLFGDGVEGEIPLGGGVDFFMDSPIRVGARGAFNWNPGVGEDLGPISENPSAWQAGLTASAAF